MAEISPKKQLIFQTAAEMFKEKGFNATSIRELASRVGLEPSSIYSHIKTKEDLLVGICMPVATYFTKGMEEINAADTSYKKKFRDLIGLHLNLVYENPASATVFNDEWIFLPEEKLAEFLSMRRDYEKKFKKILLEGKKNGKFEFQNVDIVFSFILKTLNWSYEAVNKYKKNELLESITQLLIKALGK